MENNFTSRDPGFQKIKSSKEQEQIVYSCSGNLWDI